MSVNIEFEGRNADVRPHETVLDAFVRQGLPLSFSCKAGSCHRCMLRATQGPVPDEASRRLPAHLQDKGYLLACQCRPVADMTLAAPLASDQVTDAVLLAVRPAQPGSLWLQFETARALDARPGQWLQVIRPGEPVLELQLSHAVAETFGFDALVQLPPGAAAPEWLGPEAFGVDFQVRGPLDAAPGDPTRELPLPDPDPALWNDLGEARIRAALDDFYAQVFRDPQLSPFFRGITPDRVAGQQFAFMKRAMTGEHCYFGDRPHNAHHRMVITDALFEHRQALMEETLRRHGLDEVQLARWIRFELHFRADIVKREAWPRLLKDGESPALEGYAIETLDSGTLCDHCQVPVEAGERVLFHQRLGQVSCARCAPQVAAG